MDYGKPWVELASLWVELVKPGLVNPCFYFGLWIIGGTTDFERNLSLFWGFWGGLPYLLIGSNMV